ncbi:LBF_2804 family protein [Leptospira fainei]|nr:hypothetical protein [Leptospira fainei]
MEARKDFFPEYKPGLLERWGIKILQDYVRQEERKNGPGNGQIPADFFPESNRIIRWVTFWAMHAGFWTTCGIILVEKLFPESPEFLSPIFIEKWTYAGLALLLGTILEFYILYKLGLWGAYRLTSLAGMELEDDPELLTGNVNLLARMALEIPDPDLKLLGIDPLRLTDKRSFLAATFLYKAKVLLSNLLAKIVLRKVLARNSLRVYTDFIAAPITAIWDGIVIYSILSELRIRLISRVLAREITEQILEKKDFLSTNAKLAFLAAVGNSVVFTQRFHPNLEYLLVKLFKAFDIASDATIFDDLETFATLIRNLEESEKEACLRLLCLACSFDGKLSSFETKHIKRILGKEAEPRLASIAELSRYIRSGNLEACREKSNLFS